jgi:hypothetical protein
MIRSLVIFALALVALENAHAQTTPQRLGVTTHFSQGWPITLMDRAKTIGVKTIRDSIHWPVVEKVPGQYDFSGRNALHVTRACAAGMTVLLGIEPRNPLYDASNTVHSPAARAAFANYVLAIADRFPSCVTAIEIGNEINAKNGMIGPAAVDRAVWHTALLRAVYERVKPTHPHLAIIGGSTNAIGTGFLAKLFSAGALNYLDGVAVHPYRAEPENVDWELARLNAAMLKAGKVKPIWATEFSRDFALPADAAPHFLKMLSLMQGAGVTHAYWYALIDQKWFPSMGLLTIAGGDKPASRAFAYAASHLAPQGLAQRVDHGDPALFHFRYGPTTHVVWGTRRALGVGATARFRRADGSVIAAVGEVSSDPVIIEESANVTFGTAEVLADSQLGFGNAPLTWFARSKTGALLPLSAIDWTWTSYLGTRPIRQMVVNPSGIGPTGLYSALVRFTADRAISGVASFCLSPLAARGDGVAASLMHDGKQLWSGRVGALTGKKVAQAWVNLKAGDKVDMVIAPNANAVGDRMSYRFRVSRTAADAADC